MSIETGGLINTRQTLLSIWAEARNTELDSITVRKWGRFPNANYDVNLREPILRDFLAEAMKWKPKDLRGLGIDILGSRPWRLGIENEFICPQELLDGNYAIIEEDKVTREHRFVVALFNIWPNLKKDGDLIWKFSKRKRMTEKGWAKLEKDTDLVTIRPVLRSAIEAGGRKRIEDAINDALSETGRKVILESIIHEGDHDYRYRTTHQVEIHKKDWKKKRDEELERLAEEAEAKYLNDPRWAQMVYFRANFRRQTRRAV